MKEDYLCRQIPNISSCISVPRLPRQSNDQQCVRQVLGFTDVVMRRIGGPCLELGT